jgi:Flp pilus assembly protein TadD
MMKRWMTAAVAAAVLLAPTLGAAQTAPAPGQAPSLCTRFDGRQEARDAKRVEAAQQAFVRGGHQALAREARALEAVLANAPADFQARQDCKMQAALIGGLVAASRQTGPNRTVAIEAGVLESPYPRAALMLGSLAVHNRDYPKAATVLLRGLKMQPENPYLASEASVALIQTGRRQEALDVLSRALAAEGLEAGDRARLLRTRGFALIEMQRLDEAEQAYRQSLEVEPGHPGAAGQLSYIAGLKAGGTRVAPTVSTVEEFGRPKAEPTRP